VEERKPILNSILRKKLQKHSGMKNIKINVSFENVKEKRKDV